MCFFITFCLITLWSVVNTDFFLDFHFDALYYCIKKVTQLCKGGNMNFVFDNNTPIYIQLVEQIKISIISGEIKAGERLASVRELALKLKVNPNTMLKALVELEDIGLIYTERTNGKFVTNNQELIEKLRVEYALELSKKYILGMESIGFSFQDTVKYLNDLGGDN